MKLLMIIVMKTYILTGGPGTGKSSLLNYLELYHGEHVIREAAEDYIKLRQAEGQPAPWTEEDFQEKIMHLQLQRKHALSPTLPRVFIDRGIADGLTYRPRGQVYTTILYHAQQECIDKVFLLDTLGITETTAVRRENHAQALELSNKLERTYQTLGHQPIHIPAAPLKERAQLILEAIR